MIKYYLAVGYGDYTWDLGQEDYYYDSLEELWAGFLDNVIPYENISKEEFFDMMIADEYAEDGEQMWYAKVIKK